MQSKTPLTLASTLFGAKHQFRSTGFMTISSTNTPLRSTSLTVGNVLLTVTREAGGAMKLVPSDKNLQRNTLSDRELKDLAATSWPWSIATYKISIVESGSIEMARTVKQTVSPIATVKDFGLQIPPPSSSHTAWHPRSDLY